MWSLSAKLCSITPAILHGSKTTAGFTTVVGLGVYNVKVNYPEQVQ